MNADETSMFGLQASERKGLARGVAPYNQTGYRSNEIDENSELNKITAVNAIVCHQNLIETLETTQIKL